VIKPNYKNGGIRVVYNVNLLNIQGDQTKLQSGGIQVVYNVNVVNIQGDQTKLQKWWYSCGL